MDLKSLEVDIIQGGMGVEISNNPLAREVSILGGLGVASGVARENVMTRRLQNGDPSGEIRFALNRFPDQEFSAWIIDNYYIPGGKKPDAKYKLTPFPKFKLNADDSLSLTDDNLTKLIIAANFVEVYLAKLGHNNPIGINYLYKVRYAMLPAMYGAMLAGVDALMIGAGFAKDIPNALTALAEHGDATLPIAIEGEKDKILRFEPEKIYKNKDLTRPAFFGIISNQLGLRALPNADAYIFEGPTAGGHNPPARSKSLTTLGEPDYGPADEVDHAYVRSWFNQNAQRTGKKMPYYYAGGFGSPEGLQKAKELGATGVQIGSLLGFSSGSGMYNPLRLKILEQMMHAGIVFTSPDASSSGFPFKEFLSPDTLTNPELYNARKRVCDLGYLVDLYTRKDGTIGTRCPSENASSYKRKGGLEKDTINKVCLCNGLLATVNLGSPGEMPIVTVGSDLSSIILLVTKYGLNYTVKNAMDYMRGKE
jgi:nitronate monooxygenase